MTTQRTRYMANVKAPSERPEEAFDRVTDKNAVALSLFSVREPMSLSGSGAGLSTDTRVSTPQDLMAYRSLAQTLALASLGMWAAPSAAQTAQAAPTGATLTVGILTFFAGAIAATIGTIGIQLVTQRHIQMQNVVQERAKWREDIRRLASDVHTAIMMDCPHARRTALLELRFKFRTVLNPYDREDRKILRAIDETRKCQCDSECKCSEIQKMRSDYFGELVSLLLKHDWERAKEEVKHPLFQWWTPERQGASKGAGGKVLSGTEVRRRRPLGDCFRENVRFRFCKLLVLIVFVDTLLLVALVALLSLCGSFD